MQVCITGTHCYNKATTAYIDAIAVVIALLSLTITMADAEIESIVGHRLHEGKEEVHILRKGKEGAVWEKLATDPP